MASVVYWFDGRFLVMHFVVRSPMVPPCTHSHVRVLPSEKNSEKNKFGKFFSCFQNFQKIELKI